MAVKQIFQKDITSVLRLSDEDLQRYKNMCFNHLLGVIRPEDERVQILDRIDAINAVKGKQP